MAAEETVQPEAPPTPQAEPIEIAVGDQTLSITPSSAEEAGAWNELKKGYSRQEVWTQKMQALAREREEVKQQRDQLAASRPQTGLGDGYGGWSGQSSDRAVGGSQRGSTYPTPEQPRGTPASGEPSYVPEDYTLEQDNDVVDGARFNQLVRQQQEMRQQMEYMQKMAKEQHADRAIDQMGNQVAGFNRGDVEEALAMMNDSEREPYLQMPKAQAYKLVFYEHVQPHLTETQPSEEQAQQLAAEEGPPHAEGSRNAGADLAPTPDLSGPLTPDKRMEVGRAMLARMQKPE